MIDLLQRVSRPGLRCQSASASLSPLVVLYYYPSPLAILTSLPLPFPFLRFAILIKITETAYVKFFTYYFHSSFSPTCAVSVIIGPNLGICCLLLLLLLYNVVTLPLYLLLLLFNQRSVSIFLLSDYHRAYFVIIAAD